MKRWLPCNTKNIAAMKRILSVIEEWLGVSEAAICYLSDSDCLRTTIWIEKGNSFSPSPCTLSMPFSALALLSTTTATPWPSTFHPEPQAVPPAASRVGATA